MKSKSKINENQGRNVRTSKVTEQIKIICSTISWGSFDSKAPISDSPFLLFHLHDDGL